MHGKREGLDRHDCQLCLQMALEMGENCAPGLSYLYSVMPARLLVLRERAALERQGEVESGSQSGRAVRI